MLSGTDETARYDEGLLREEASIVIIRNCPDLSQCLDEPTQKNVSQENGRCKDEGGNWTDLTGKLSRLEEADGLLACDDAEVLYVCLLEEELVRLLFVSSQAKLRDWIRVEIGGEA